MLQQEQQTLMIFLQTLMGLMMHGELQVMTLIVGLLDLMVLMLHKQQTLHKQQQVLLKQQQVLLKQQQILTNLVAISKIFHTLRYVLPYRNRHTI